MSEENGQQPRFLSGRSARRLVELGTLPGYNKLVLHKSINHARDLTPPVKSALESLLGQPRQDDEQVSVRVFRRHLAPRGAGWRKAARRLEKQLERMAGKVKGVPAEDMEAAIDEAIAHILSDEFSSPR